MDLGIYTSLTGPPVRGRATGGRRSRRFLLLTLTQRRIANSFFHTEIE